MKFNFFENAFNSRLLYFRDEPFREKGSVSVYTRIMDLVVSRGCYDDFKFLLGRLNHSCRLQIKLRDKVNSVSSALEVLLKLNCDTLFIIMAILHICTENYAD